MEGLSLLHIHKSYRQEAALRPVLQGVSLTVGQGELVTLLGRSGSGKTTLLRIAAGYEHFDAGVALWQNAPINGPSPDRMVVFQSFDQLFPWRRIGSNLCFALRTVNPRLSRQEAQEQADFWLEQTGLASGLCPQTGAAAAGRAFCGLG